MLEKIEKVLDEKVRPELAAHNGNIQVVDFTDGIVRFKFLGQCANCPTAYLTTENLVKTTLVEAISEVKDAILVQAVSDDLLAQARAILNRNRHE